MTVNAKLEFNAPLLHIRVMLSTVRTRGLTPDEIALLPRGFTSHIDINRVRFIGRTHNPFAYGKILVRGYNIYWKTYPADFARTSLAQQAILIHELCHVWQYATGRLSAVSYLTQPKNWAYGYHYEPRKSFDDYAIERQADLLQDWYAMNHGAPPSRYDRQSQVPTLSQINAVIPFMWDMPPIEVDQDGLLIV